MSYISSNTSVFIWIHHPPNSGQRAWLGAYTTPRNQLGEIFLKPEFFDDPREAKSFKYEFALIVKRRLENEGYMNPNFYAFHFSLNPTGEEVAGGSTTSAPDKDGRVVMQYRGLLVQPGRDVNIGPCWFVKFPGQAIESVRGTTPEVAVDKTYERNLQHLAEQAPPPEPEPEAPSAPTTPFEGRLRPGSIRNANS